MGIEELYEQIRRDELADAADTGFMKPIQYAKYRGIRPQQVYSAIRSGKLQAQICQCGSKVVNVEEADKLWRKDNDDFETD